MQWPERERSLPGADLVARGLTDLEAQRETAEALLVSIGAARLRSLGFEVDSPFDSPEHRLYLRLAQRKRQRGTLGLQRAHSPPRQLRASSAMRDLADESHIDRFMRALGRAAKSEGRVYLTGGATAVLHGWRESTIDIDIKVVPESDDLLREIPRLKEQLNLNVELAAPSDLVQFPPAGRGEVRSFVEKADLVPPLRPGRPGPREGGAWP